MLGSGLLKGTSILVLYHVNSRGWGTFFGGKQEVHYTIQGHVLLRSTVSSSFEKNNVLSTFAASSNLECSSSRTWVDAAESPYSW